MFSAKKHHRICGNQGVCVFYLQGLCSRSLLVHFWSARRKPTCCHHSCFWKRKARGEVRQGSLSRVICLFPSQLPSFKFFFLFLFRYVIFTFTHWLNVTLWDSFHSLSFRSLAPLLACSSYLACSLNRIAFSSNMCSHFCASIFSLTFSYIHPPLIWFTFWVILMQRKYRL